MSSYYEGDSSYVTTTDLVKQQNNRFALSKVEGDLFDDDKDLVNFIINVRRVTSSGLESWKIFKTIPNISEEVIFIIDGEKLTKKERAFLRSPDGVLFLIAQAKVGIKSFNSLKKIIRQNL